MAKRCHEHPRATILAGWLHTLAWPNFSTVFWLTAWADGFSQVLRKVLAWSSSELPSSLSANWPINNAIKWGKKNALDSKEKRVKHVHMFSGAAFLAEVHKSESVSLGHTGDVSKPEPCLMPIMLFCSPICCMIIPFLLMLGRKFELWRVH